jgi:hypothetical protein
MIEHIDAFLLRQAQRFTDWFQDWTGLNKFWLEKVTYISWIMFVAASWAATKERTLASALIILLMLASTGFGTARISREDSDFMSTGHLRHDMTKEPYFRVMMLCFFSTLAVGDFTSALHTETFRHALRFTSHVSFILMIYIAGCAPKPPGRSRLGQLREMSQERLKTVSSPASEPTPV